LLRITEAGNGRPAGGVDAAPYFRIFNPQEQQKKFDPDFQYIKQWVPEFGTPDYPEPVVEHRFARKRCLEVFGMTLKKNRQLNLL
jgi:deoxyribodipyrimidine photo-lyase